MSILKSKVYKEKICRARANFQVLLENLGHFDIDSVLRHICCHTGCPKKMYHICFAHSFHTFLRNLLKHTSKDSQIHGDLLTPPPDSVTRPWRSRCHVLEVSTVLGHAQRCSASGLLGLVSTCGGGNPPDGSTNSLVQDTWGFWCPLVHDAFQVSP